MSYVALRFDVEAADADAWSDALLEAGALSVDAVDPRAGTAGRNRGVRRAQRWRPAVVADLAA